MKTNELTGSNYLRIWPPGLILNNLDRMQTRLRRDPVERNRRFEAVNTSLETGEEKAVSTHLASFVPSNNSNEGLDLSDVTIRLDSRKRTRSFLSKNRASQKNPLFIARVWRVFEEGSWIAHRNDCKSVFDRIILLISFRFERSINILVDFVYSEESLNQKQRKKEFPILSHSWSREKGYS